MAAAAGTAASVALISIEFSTPRPQAPIAAERLASGYRTELLNRLRLADRALRSVAAKLGEQGNEGALPGFNAERTFQAISVAKPGVPPVAMLGTPAAIPVLENPLPQRLANGDSVIIAVAPEGGSVARIVMLRNLLRSGLPDGLLAAEIAPHYLWESTGLLQEAADLCVRDELGSVLHCTSAQGLAALRSMSVDLQAASGALEWRSDAESWNGGYARFDLQEAYAGGQWTALAIATAPPPVAPGAIAQTLGKAFLGATPFGALIAFVAVRKWRRRKRKPAQGEIASDRSDRIVAGEGRAVADDPQIRTAQLQEAQGRAMRALAEIDRASLSRTKPQHVVDLAARHLLACTGCEVLLIGVLDPDVASRLTILLAGKDGADRLLEHKPVDAAARQLLTVPTDGVWLRRGREFSLLEMLVRRGADVMLTLPVHEETKAIGFVSLGFGAGSAVSADVSSYARAIASRLSATLTSAARVEALYARSHFDATTGLPNRVYLKEHLALQMKRARRERTCLALLFIGLDGFKKVNESLDHSRGDLALAETAQRLRRCVREADLVTRFCGDEFVVVLPDLAEGLCARQVADKVLAALDQPFQVDGQEHRLGCSIGISVFPDDAQTVGAMLRSADSAMFAAKAAGRGRYVFFDAACNHAAIERTALEGDLWHALKSSEFCLEYQPQIDLRSGVITGAEALVRWPHPTRGRVPPSEFVALAEKVGAIGQLSDLVLRKACAQFREWDAQGIAPRRVAVNISGQEVARTDLVARVEGVLKDTGLRPMFLELEITEGTFIGDAGDSLAKLRQIQGRGVQIAVDDFGTGYSSLSYLKQLPIDVIKVDQSFVREVTDDPSSRSITRAIIEMAHGLGMSVVAEGVETGPQRAMLAQWGCEVGQGYYWSPSLPAAEFARFCRDWRDAGQHEGELACRA